MEDYQHGDFRRLVGVLVDGAPLPEPIAPSRPKIFCDEPGWLVRDSAGRWQPTLGSDSRAGRSRDCAIMTK